MFNVFDHDTGVLVVVLVRPIPQHPAFESLNFENETEKTKRFTSFTYGGPIFVPEVEINKNKDQEYLLRFLWVTTRWIPDIPISSGAVLVVNQVVLYFDFEPHNKKLYLQLTRH